jgi:hypothetical protein
MSSQWGDQSPELAAWAFRTLVNRDDAYGFYLPPDKRKGPRDAARTLKRRLTVDLLAQHFAGTEVLGLHTTSVDSRCRWLVVDIDRHDPGDSPEANRQAAITIYTKAIDAGCSAILEDSDGRGGFHLWILFSEPIAAAEARRFGLCLVEGLKDFRLSREPEVFPKQDELRGGKFGNWVRLPGRHHTHDHWSKIWDGRRWQTGPRAARLLLDVHGSPASVIPATIDPGTERPTDKPERQGRKLPSLGFLRRLIFFLPAKYHGHYDLWLKVGTILRPYGDEGLAIWEAWSRHCPKYERGACPAKWPSLRAGSVNYQTLIKWANDEGWKKVKKVGDQSSTARHETAETKKHHRPRDVGIPAGSVPGTQAGGGSSDATRVNRDVMHEPEPAHPVPVAKTKVRIIWNQRQLPEVTEAALEALRLDNRPPRLFAHGDSLLRIRRSDGKIKAELVSEDALIGHLGRAANWYKAYASEDSPRLQPTFPLNNIARDILSLPEWPERVFPRLKGVLRCPVLASHGRVIDRPGYDAESGLYYEPDPGLEIPEIPEQPTDDELAEARSLLMDELLGGFPFAPDASNKANALAYVLTPFVRNIIDDNTPLGLIDAPVRGTGKTKLAECIAALITGTLETTAPPENDEEWRKAITATLASSPQVVIYDNLEGELKSRPLVQVLTTRVWTARELGYSRDLHLPVNCTWLGTANNLNVVGDMIRRIVWIRLDAQMEHPEDREPSSFKHPMPQWALQNRGRLIRAALVLVNAWLSRGRPAGREIMGGFETWSATLGGILQVASVEGFLSNRKDRRDVTDEESSVLNAFYEEWRATGQTEDVRVGDFLYQLVEGKGLLPGVLTAKTEGGRRRQLGRFLAKMKDRVAGRNQMVQGTPDHSGLHRYSLKDAPTQGQRVLQGPKYEATCPWGDFDLEELLPYHDYEDDAGQARAYRRLVRATRGQILSMERSCRELHAFKLDLWATHRDWLIVSDVTLLHFAENYQHLRSWLTGRTGPQRLAQLHGAMRYAANPGFDDQGITLYDEVSFSGRRRLRYLLDLEPREDRRSCLTGHPAESAEAHLEVAQFLHDWWRFNHASLASDLEGILRMVEGLGLLGTLLPLDPNNRPRRLRKLDDLMKAISLVEFDGFMIEPEYEAGEGGGTAANYGLCRLPGHEPPPFEAQGDDQGKLWRRHCRPRKVTPADFMSLIE